MAFFQGMIVFFKTGTKLSPSEHRAIFDESSGQRAVEIHFINIMKYDLVRGCDKVLAFHLHV